MNLPRCKMSHHLPPSYSQALSHTPANASYGKCGSTNSSDLHLSRDSLVDPLPSALCSDYVTRNVCSSVSLDYLSPPAVIEWAKSIDYQNSPLFALSSATSSQPINSTGTPLPLYYTHHVLGPHTAPLSVPLTPTVLPIDPASSSTLIQHAPVSVDHTAHNFGAHLFSDVSAHSTSLVSAVSAAAAHFTYNQYQPCVRQQANGYMAGHTTYSVPSSTVYRHSDTTSVCNINSNYTEISSSLPISAADNSIYLNCQPSVDPSRLRRVEHTHEHSGTTDTAASAAATVSSAQCNGSLTHSDMLLYTNQPESVTPERVRQLLEENSKLRSEAITMRQHIQYLLKFNSRLSVFERNYEQLVQLARRCELRERQTRETLTEKLRQAVDHARQQMGTSAESGQPAGPLEQEVRAQRETLFEQRQYIDILHTALARSRESLEHAKQEYNDKLMAERQKYTKNCSYLQRMLIAKQLSSDRCIDRYKKHQVELENELIEARKLQLSSNNTCSSTNQALGDASRTETNAAAAQSDAEMLLSLRRQLRESQQRALLLETELTCAQQKDFGCGSEALMLDYGLENSAAVVDANSSRNISADYALNSAPSIAAADARISKSLEERMLALENQLHEKDEMLVNMQRTALEVAPPVNEVKHLQSRHLADDYQLQMAPSVGCCVNTQSSLATPTIVYAQPSISSVTADCNLMSMCQQRNMVSRHQISQPSLIQPDETTVAPSSASNQTSLEQLNNQLFGAAHPRFSLTNQISHITNSTSLFTQSHVPSAGMGGAINNMGVVTKTYASSVLDANRHTHSQSLQQAETYSSGTAAVTVAAQLCQSTACAAVQPGNNHTPSTDQSQSAQMYNSVGGGSVGPDTLHAVSAIYTTSISHCLAPTLNLASCSNASSSNSIMKALQKDSEVFPEHYWQL